MKNKSGGVVAPVVMARPCTDRVAAASDMATAAVNLVELEFWLVSTLLLPEISCFRPGVLFWFFRRSKTLPAAEEWCLPLQPL